MYPLFESICVEGGVIKNREYHIERFQSSYVSYFGSNPNFLLLDDVLLEELPQQGKYKLRIAYGKLGKQRTLSQYKEKEITSLKLIEDDDIEYHLKFSDRNKIDILYDRRGSCDDILIIKKGMVTDSSYCNILFYDGSNWVTPYTTLLSGSCRQRLLYERKVIENNITIEDIGKYKGYQLVNAMKDFIPDSIIPISHIMY